MTKKLSAKMTKTDFENGYWYATDLKRFALSLGLPDTAGLRKDQLEKLILDFLKTGKVRPPKKKNHGNARRDLDIGLTLDLPVIHYVSNNQTKQFLMKEALKINPQMPKKSGACYWMNRWREKQLEQGRSITYRDLVKQFMKLNQSKEPLPQIPSTRFNNFIADFLKSEKSPTRAAALKAWEQLKK